MGVYVMKKKINILITLSLLLSNNCFSQSGWVLQTTPVTDNLFAVFFANTFTGYAAGENGRMIKTTNGGLNWFIIGTGVTNQYLTVIQFFDANTGYVSGNWTGSIQNNFWKTTNGGVNWTLIGTLSPGRMQFINLNLGWSIINEGMAKTTNGGVQWSFYSFDPICPNCSMNDVFFHDPDTGYTAGDYWNSSQNMGYVHIFKTINGGSSWNLKFVYQSNANPYAPQLGHFFFPKTQRQIGYALGSYEIYAGLYKTTNSGENWFFKKQFQYAASFQWFTSIDTGWVTSTQGRIMFTSDGGSNFIAYPTGTTSDLNRIFFINDTTGWVAGNNGVILARNAGLLGIQLINNELPQSFSLSQNYPNPFNPVTRIKFNLPVSSDVKLVIYDVLGREIETLLNENKKPGSYEVNWDGSRYASGVYFYKLITDEFVETKKMVLVK